jgi:hypothetical protein
MFDTNFISAACPFPHIGEAPRGDGVTTNFDKISGNLVRGREDCVVGAYGLEFVEASAGNIVCRGDNVEYLGSPFSEVRRS